MSRSADSLALRVDANMRNAVTTTSVVRISPAGTIPNNSIRPLSVRQNRGLRAGVGVEERVISGSPRVTSFSKEQRS